MKWNILEIASSQTLTSLADLHIVHVWNAMIEHAIRGTFLNVTEDKVVAYIEQVRRHHAISLDGLLHDVLSNQGQDEMNCLKLQNHLIGFYPVWFDGETDQEKL